ncbi:hypothetical protein C7447_10751 [Tenacibaculum adriaticum]|uniref:Uncharacterized protein n=1 Tax=Tenacibaculum adriaticum TaxID=413713 RepID=A0A5S5DLA1_9FLAO|nr:hypothetical protein [Tenacibaculum adriaticum]TYP96485.1 hypothetical protein C7447_10751 [Tenacibaculum adriaticum]
MKTPTLKTVLLLAAITFFNCSNNDDPIVQDQLPHITQTGANTFGCIINGEVLIPKNSNGVPNAKGLEVYHKSNNNLIIDVNNYSNTNSNGSIYIYIYDLTSAGNFTLGLSEGLRIFILNQIILTYGVEHLIKIMVIKSTYLPLIVAL